jgi:hypothetical protein
MVTEGSDFRTTRNARRQQLAINQDKREQLARGRCRCLGHLRTLSCPGSRSAPDLGVEAGTATRKGRLCPRGREWSGSQYRQGAGRAFFDNRTNGGAVSTAAPLFHSGGRSRCPERPGEDRDGDHASGIAWPVPSPTPRTSTSRRTRRARLRRSGRSTGPRFTRLATSCAPPFVNKWKPLRPFSRAERAAESR